MLGFPLYELPQQRSVSSAYLLFRHIQLASPLLSAACSFEQVHRYPYLSPISADQAGWRER
jgi:hypothetical protein